jgi:hypothetical protein
VRLDELWIPAVVFELKPGPMEWNQVANSPVVLQKVKLSGCYKMFVYIEMTAFGL